MNTLLQKKKKQSKTILFLRVGNEIQRSHLPCFDLSCHRSKKLSKKFFKNIVISTIIFKRMGM